MKYILDISGLPDEYLNEYPFLKPLPKKIPVQSGKHQKKYDVIEDEVGEDIMAEVKRIQRETHPLMVGSKPEWPIGFNYIPDGAKLIKTTPQEDR